MTKDDIIRMAREAGLALYPGWVTDGEGLENLERFAALVAAAEREACIKACDSVDLIGADECIEAIRARGQE